MAIKHFYEQKEYAKEYVVIYLASKLYDSIIPFRIMRTLEVGCAEGGLVNELYHQEMHITGLEINEDRVKTARHFNRYLEIFQGDITDKDISGIVGETFDLIIMQDVIEHISDKDTALSNVKQLLRYNGYLYITFPTRQSPFAGHQQNLKSWLRYLPYLSYFPDKVIRFVGKLAKDKGIEEVIHNKYNAVNMTAFENMCQNMGFKIIDKNYYLSRPIFKLRYNLPTVRAFNHFTTFGCEYLMQYSPV